MEESNSSFVCAECGSKFANKQSLNVHRSKNKNSDGILECKTKKEAKKERKRKRKEETTLVASLNKTQILNAVNAVEQQETTNDLLKKLTEQNNQLMNKMTDIEQQNNLIEQQNSELKEMVTEFARNPQLLILVDKLYPLSSLRELDLKRPAFKPVLEILDKELPEYPNLVNDETGKVHCKAVKKLNEIQPTVVKDDEKLFYKKGDVLTHGSGEEATKEFIDVIANSGYEYAQKASKDLKSRRESDKDFKRGILKNAACHGSIQDVTDI